MVHTTGAHMHNLRVGAARAFGGWKLVWENAEGITVMVDISSKAARALIKDGMPSEG